MTEGRNNGGNDGGYNGGMERRNNCSFSTCCTQKGERRRGTFHVIKQTFIRYDLGSHYKTAQNIGGGGAINWHGVITCAGGSSYSPINIFSEN